MIKTIYSWIILNDNEFCKVVDKSVIETKESGIPQEAIYLFDLHEEYKNIKLIFNKEIFEAKLTTKTYKGTTRSKIRFVSFINKVKHFIKVSDIIYFNKLDTYTYEVKTLRCIDLSK